MKDSWNHARHLLIARRLIARNLPKVKVEGHAEEVTAAGQGL